MARRGEIYYVDWSPGRGSEQAGIRPALVIQNDTGNRLSPTTIVVAISTQRRRRYPFHVAITAQETNLSEDSVVKCEQIQIVDQSRLGRLVGPLNGEKMLEIDQALHQSLGLEH